MKKFLLLLCCAVHAALAANPPTDKSFLQELEQKARVQSYVLPPAEKLLPPDTLAFLTVPDWTKAQAAFTNSTTGQLWADPAMKAFKDAFFDRFNAEKIQPLEKELGFQFTNFLNLARGQFTLGVVPNGWDGRSERQPGVLWLLDTKENSLQLKTNLAGLREQWMKSGRKMRTEKIRDVEFTVVIVDAQEINRSLPQFTPGPKTPGAPDEPTATRAVEWVIGQSGSLLVVSDAAKDVEKVLALQARVVAPALAEQAAFAASASSLRGANSFAWVNVKPIMTTLARKPAERPGEPPPLGALPSMDKFLGALGLSGVQSITFSWQQAVDGSTAHIAVRVPESGRKGLFNILAVESKDAAPPPFIPADAVKFTRWRIDLQKAWTTIEAMLLEVSPQYAGFSKLILDTAGKDKDPKFDFRQQLLANLGDDVITFEPAPRGTNTTTTTLTLVGSKNAAQMAASLRAVTSIFPPEMIQYSERDFLGRKIYSVVIPSMGVGSQPRPLTYAASGGYVVLSSEPAALEEFLRGGETNARPLRAFPGLAEAGGKAGGTGHGYFSFKNQAETARAAFAAAKNDPGAITEVLGAGQLTTILGMLGGTGQSTAELIDVTKLPAFEKVAKYFHFDVSAIGVTPEVITFKTFTPTSPALRK